MLLQWCCSSRHVSHVHKGLPKRMGQFDKAGSSALNIPGGSRVHVAEHTKSGPVQDRLHSQTFGLRLFESLGARRAR